MNKSSVLRPLVALSLLLASSAQGSMIEVGLDAGGAIVTPWSSEDFAETLGYTVGANANLEFIFVNAALEARYTELEGNQRFEARASGGALLLKVHELYYRKSDLDGEAMHGMGGAGMGIDLPGSIGSVSASLGAMAMRWERPGQDAQEILGAYAGAIVKLRVWKAHNELKVAYFATRDDWNDGYGESYTEGWKHGVIGSGRAFVKLFKISGVELGPELRGQLAKLPDGTEWMATLGLAGSLAQ